MIQRLIEGDTYDEIRYALVRMGHARVSRAAISYYANLPVVASAVEQRRKSLVDGSLAVGELRLRRLVNLAERLWQQMYYPEPDDEGKVAEPDIPTLSREFLRAIREISRLVDPLPGSLGGTMAGEGGSVVNIFQQFNSQYNGGGNTVPGANGWQPLREVEASEQILLRALDRVNPQAADAYRQRIAHARGNGGVVSLPAPAESASNMVADSDTDSDIEAEFVEE